MSQETKPLWQAIRDGDEITDPFLRRKIQAQLRGEKVPTSRLTEVPSALDTILFPGAVAARGLATTAGGAVGGALAPPQGVLAGIEGLIERGVGAVMPHPFARGAATDAAKAAIIPWQLGLAAKARETLVPEEVNRAQSKLVAEAPKAFRAAADAVNHPSEKVSESLGRLGPRVPIVDRTVGQLVGEDVPEALGASVPFIVGGGIAGAAGIGALSQAGNSYSQTLAKTGDEKKAWTAYVAGLPSGATEALDASIAGGQLSRISKKLGGGFLTALMVNGAAEGLQEGSQQVLQDYVESKLTGEEKDFLQSFAHAAIVGTALGGILGGPSSLQEARGNKADAEAKSRQERVGARTEPVVREAAALSPESQAEVDTFAGEIRKAKPPESPDGSAGTGPAALAASEGLRGVQPSTPAEKFAVEALQAIGREAVLVERSAGGRLGLSGKVSQDGKRVLLDANAPSEALFEAVAFHEILAHSGEGKALYESWKANDPEGMALAEVQSRRDHEKAGVPFQEGTDLAQEEAVGWYAEQAIGYLKARFQDPAGLARAFEANPGFARRVLDTLRDLLAKIPGLGISSTESRRWNKIRREFAITGFEAKRDADLMKRAADLAFDAYTRMRDAAASQSQTIESAAAPSAQTETLPEQVSAEPTSKLVEPAAVPSKATIFEGAPSATVETPGGKVSLPRPGFVASDAFLDESQRGKGKAQSELLDLASKHGRVWMFEPFSQDILRTVGALERKGKVTVAREEVAGAASLEITPSKAPEPTPADSSPVVAGAPARPSKRAPVASKPVKMADKIRERALTRGSFQNYVRAYGGVRPDTKEGLELAGTFSKKEHGKNPFGLGPIVHQSGSTRGKPWEEIKESAFEDGFFPGFASSAEVTYQDFYEALESNAKRKAEMEAEAEKLKAQEDAAHLQGLTPKQYEKLAKPARLRAEVAARREELKAERRAKRDARERNKPRDPKEREHIDEDEELPPSYAVEGVPFAVPRDDAPFAQMPKGKIIGRDINGDPIYSKVERGDAPRVDAGIKKAKASQVGMFDEQGGLFEKQAEERDSGRTRFAVAKSGDSEGFDIPEPGRAAIAYSNIVSEFERIRAYEREAPKPVRGGESIDQALTLMPGRIFDAHERAREEIFDAQRKVIADAKIPAHESTEAKVSASDFLYALHAPRANEVLAEENKDRGAEINPGSGMRTSEAEAIVTKALASPQADAYRELQKLNRKRNRTVLDVWESGGLLRPETTNEATGEIIPSEAAHLRERWGEDFVPLRSIEEPSDLFKSTGKSLTVSGKEYKRRGGRSTKADSPLAFSQLTLEQAIERKERNRIGNLLGDMARQNPELGVRVESDRNKVKAGEEALSFKENGEQRWLVTGDKELAASFRRLGPDPGPIKYLDAANRYLRRVIIDWNFAFPFTNAAKDIATASIKHAMGTGSGLGAGVAAGAVSAKNSLPAMRGAWSVLKDPKAKGYWEDRFRESRAAGGHIGWAKGYGDIRERMASFEAAESRALPIRAAKAYGDFMESVSKSVELGTRIATYDYLVKHGKTPAQAAVAMRRISTDFAVKGHWAPIYRRLYLFSGSSVQGTFGPGGLVDTMRKNPTRAATVAGMLIGAGYLSALASFAFGDDDELEKLSENDKARFQGVMIGNKRLGSLAPWGFNVFAYLGWKLAELSTGRAKAEDLPGQLFTASLESFSPMPQGANFVQALTPTVARAPVEIEQNKDFAGRPIMPAENPYARVQTPDHLRKFKSVSKAADLAATWLSKVGWEVSPESLEHLAKAATGGLGTQGGRLVNAIQKTVTGDADDLRISDIPIVRAFVQQPARGADTGIFYRNLTAIAEEAQKKKLGEDYDADVLRWEKLSKMIEKQIGTLRDAQDAAKDEARKATLQERIDFLRDRLNRAMREPATR